MLHNPTHHLPSSPGGPQPTRWRKAVTYGSVSQSSAALCPMVPSEFTRYGNRDVRDGSHERPGLQLFHDTRLVLVFLNKA